MRKIGYCFQHELLLLSRDIPGLLVIFLMPVLLVFVVTIVQENVLKSMGETRTRILLIDQDERVLGKKIVDGLKKSDSVSIVKEIKGKRPDIETAKKLVAKGEFQFALLIPKGTSDRFVGKAKQSAKKTIAGNDDNRASKDNGKEPDDGVQIRLYSDPTIRESFREAVSGALQKILLAIETDEKMKSFGPALSERMKAALRKAMGPLWTEDMAKSIPRMTIRWDATPIISVSEEVARYGNLGKVPNTVQQNIPAWTLFGMFFIVVPLAGGLVRERHSGILVRLLSMPLSYLTVLWGKILAYLVICLAQFLIILAIGSFALPLLGTPRLEMGSSPFLLLLVALSAGLAATGYGILLGTISRTHEQASTFGAVSVVVAAAFGGIMVPSYVMPRSMQQLSHLSPLSWGLEAFLDVFIRGGEIRSVLPNAALLLLFFLATVLIAWFYMSRKGRIS